MAYQDDPEVFDQAYALYQQGRFQESYDLLTAAQPSRDSRATAPWTPFPFLNIHGGYRAMSLKIDNISDIYARMDFYAPYPGVALSF